VKSQVSSIMSLLRVQYPLLLRQRTVVVVGDVQPSLEGGLFSGDLIMSRNRESVIEVMLHVKKTIVNISLVEPKATNIRLMELVVRCTEKNFIPSPCRARTTSEVSR